MNDIKHPQLNGALLENNRRQMHAPVGCTNLFSSDDWTKWKIPMDCDIVSYNYNTGHYKVFT